MQNDNTDEASRSADEHTPFIYDQLRRIASSYLRRERGAHTLQPTALVHEAWVKLAHQSDARVSDEAHFRALASQAMRRILVDHARGKIAAKRDGGGERVTLAGLVSPAGDALQDLDLLALDTALERLADVSPRQARIVELRFFGGLSIEQTAAELDISTRTVNGDWRVARAWLERALDTRDT